MGIIRTALAGEARSVADWLVNDDTGDGGRMTSAGVIVGRREALGLTTYWRCVDLITHAVSGSPASMAVRIGDRVYPEFANVPQWIALPNPADPNYTLADHFAEQTLASLIEGNYFTSVLPSVWEPLVLTAHDPDRVRVRPGPWYDLLDASGKVIITLGPDQMLHGWWMKIPGQLRGIAPLEVHRRGLGGAVAADEFGTRFFGQGAALSFGVEIPGEMTPDQKKDLRDGLKKEHTGIGQAHAIGILTRGGKFVTGLAPTPEQSQMLATRKFSVEDIARIFGVPPGMAGSQEPGASSYASAVEWRRQFRWDVVAKFTDKLRRSYGRLLSVPDSVTAPGAVAELRFDLDWIDRADELSRYQAYEVGVRGGFTTPDEVRGREGKAPRPGGDKLYMQAQMTPVELLGQAPAPVAAVRSVAEEVSEALEPLIRSLDREPVAPVINVTTPAVTVTNQPPAAVGTRTRIEYDEAGRAVVVTEEAAG
jgi:HK97 family phage portal protein